MLFPIKPHYSFSKVLCSSWLEIFQEFRQISVSLSCPHVLKFKSGDIVFLIVNSSHEPDTSYSSVSKEHKCYPNAIKKHIYVSHSVCSTVPISPQMHTDSLFWGSDTETDPLLVMNQLKILPHYALFSPVTVTPPFSPTFYGPNSSDSLRI